MAYITEDAVTDPSGACATCTTPGRCKAIRWTERPCEQQIKDGLPLPPAPWQVARPEDTDPTSINAHTSWCRSRRGLLFDPYLCDCERTGGTPFTEAVHQQHQELARDVAAREEAAMHAFASGAKSSEHKLRYDLIPFHIFLDRLAKRYTDGAVKYGEYNWQKGLTERAYVLDRLNHLLVHVTRLVETIRAQMGSDGDILAINFEAAMSREGFDDDAAAAMWGLIFAMAAQRGSAEL
jgi:hypothetical protein